MARQMFFLDIVFKSGLEKHLSSANKGELEDVVKAYRDVHRAGKASLYEWSPDIIIDFNEVCMLSIFESQVE